MAGRTWIAVALACFIWFAYLKWFAPPVPQNDATSQAPTNSAAAPKSEPAALPLFARPITDFFPTSGGGSCN